MDSSTWRARSSKTAPSSSRSSRTASCCSRTVSASGSAPTRAEESRVPRRCSTLGALFLLSLAPAIDLADLLGEHAEVQRAGRLVLFHILTLGLNERNEVGRAPFEPVVAPEPDHDRFVDDRALELTPFRFRHVLPSICASPDVSLAALAFFRPSGARELDAPDRALGVERPLEFHEGRWKGRGRDPVAQVGRLLADDRGQDTHHAAELEVDQPANRLASHGPDAELVDAFGLDRPGQQAWRGRESQKPPGRGLLGAQVLEQNQRHAVVQVGGQVEPSLHDLLFGVGLLSNLRLILTGVPREGDLAAAGKHWSALGQTIARQAEQLLLAEGHALVE